jgi:lycopene cyclase domain-containing protein
MTYLYFHLVFILPVIGVVWWLRRSERALALPWQRTGIATLTVIALVYTTPWDNYLVAHQIWTYGEGRVLESLIIGYVPIEEYFFFILQPIMTGCLLLLYAGRQGVGKAVFGRRLQRGRPAWLGATAFLVVTGLGVACLTVLPQRFTYMGLILAWAGPVLAFQWAYGGGTLWSLRALLIPAVRTPTLYLWVVDFIAIEWRIWTILPATSTGWKLFSLPVEEAVFFLVTNLLVVQGLILFYQASCSWPIFQQKTKGAP